jgi:diadenosine tetraphosphatase ApaH/serine/threonine PP2A family protein phosphatase
MKIAIFSDVHSNLPALDAVLKDIDEQEVNLRVCLGDTVGYNADPADCLERVRAVSDAVIQGNHDLYSATSEGLADFNPVARAGVEFSRKNLTDAQKKWLHALPLVKNANDHTYVHASLFSPEDWIYVSSPLEAMLHFREQKTPVAFCGHTHRPVVWHSDDGPIEAFRPRERMKLDKPGKYLVNVGSVGQVRDGDPRACYVIYEPEKRALRYRRIEYDIHAAQKIILAAGLPPFLAMRLQAGM